MYTRKQSIKGAVAAILSLWLGAFGTVNSFAGEFETDKMTDKLKFTGDFRLRHESFFNKNINGSSSTANRHRERMRLRFGVVGQLQDFTVGFRMASGSGEQTSTNQSFANNWSQKALFIDQAYVSWKAHEYIKLTGGKMPNPIWRTYSTDVIWDNDLNPEGYAEQVEMPMGDRLSMFANFAQLPINEISGVTTDPWVFANQIGAGLKVTEDTTVRLAGAFYGFINENKSPFHTLNTATAGTVDSSVIQEANTRSAAGTTQLASTFKIVNFTAEVASHLGPLPVSVQGDFVRNTAPGNNALQAQNANGQTDGYQFGAIVGKAKAKGNWEVAYFRKWVQANATISDWADSDFGNGGTNRKGHIMWFAYALRDNVNVQTKYFNTQKLNSQLSSAAPYNLLNNAKSDINRFQLDLVFKF